jgi:diaminopimelate decarboxylase
VLQRGIGIGLLIAGVNAGLNLQSLWAYYQTPFIATPVEPRAGDRKRYMVTGNINEAIDILAEDVVLPPLEEGDLIALLNAGGYGSACASNHIASRAPRARGRSRVPDRSPRRPP